MTRIRPVWLFLTLLAIPPVLIAAYWMSLPAADHQARCMALPPIGLDEEAALKFSIDLRSAILDNPGGPFELDVTDVGLTSYILLNLEGRQLAYPQIRFLKDTVCLSGQIVGFGLLNPHLRIIAGVYATAGMLQFDLEQVIVNDRVLPAPLRRIIQRIVNESIQDAGFPLRISRVKITRGHVMITGERLP